MPGVPEGVTDDVKAPDDPLGDDTGLTVFKVSGHTMPLSLANSIASVLREQDYLELQAIGASAIYRAVTALTIARILLADYDVDLTFTPVFHKFLIDGGELAGLLFGVEYRPRADQDQA